MGKPAAFDIRVTAARAALLETEPGPYEEALIYLGWLAGAHPSEGDGRRTAAPDATWVFGDSCWVCWEAKSDAEADGEVGADTARQAGAHLWTTATRYDSPIPSGSVSLLVAPQTRIHGAARALAESHVYTLRPSDVIDLFDRLVRAWRKIRARGDSVTADTVNAMLSDEHALPTHWLPTLTREPLAQTPTHKKRALRQRRELGPRP